MIDRLQVLSNLPFRGYARASAEMLFWLITRAVLQAGSVILLARVLGVTNYGHFVAALAVASFFAPLAGMGLAGVVLRDGASESRRLPELLGAGLWVWLPGVLVLGPVAAVVAWVVLPEGSIALWALMSLAVGEVAASSGVEILARVHQARQHMRAFGATMAGLMAARFFALLLYSSAGTPDAMGWMVVYGLSGLGYLALLFTLQQRDWRGRVERQPRFWREGMPFAVGAVSLRVQAEFNKPVLAHVSYADAGLFGIAQRAVDLCTMPLMALQETLWPRIYADAEPRRRLRQALLVLLALASLLGLLLTLAAPVLPTILGSEFDAAAPALAWLAWLPLLQVLRNVGNAKLIVAGQTHRISRIYIIGALSGAGLSLLLIPSLGLLGAVLVVYGNELVLIVLQQASRRQLGRRP